ncbi:MAG: hypothetical protein IKB95_06315, partial [Bacteroidales bacterium]|nr:hypothetical protein [Bacteroidales bacterium]
MKLIVLYGQKDSGKTTTLKMVYEVLKKQNTQEEKKFTYLDRHYYNDFRDVLVIDKPQDFANLSVEEVGDNPKLLPKEEEPVIYGEDDNLDDIYPDDVTNNNSPIPTTMRSDFEVDNATDS